MHPLFPRPRPVSSAALLLLPLLLGSACAAGRTAAPSSSPALVRQLSCMGTGLRISVWDAPRAGALAGSEAAVRALEATERRLSTWNEESELARLNAAPAGVRHPLSPALAADLTAVARWVRITEGAFDPAVGRLVRIWGLREGGRRPSDAELAAAPSSFAALRREGDTATRTDDRLLLEEGGFGKGIGLDAALAALRGHGVARALVDLGGQLAFLPGNEPLRLAVAHPDARARALLEIAVAAPGSLATTGNSERGLVVDGVRLSHVLDPRTGRPVADFGSVTVLAPTAVAADCLSTALFVMGPDGARRWWRETGRGLDGVEFLLLVRTPRGLSGLATPGLRGRLRILAGDFSLRFLSPPEGEGPTSKAASGAADPLSPR